jgi:hypothetical protein
MEGVDLRECKTPEPCDPGAAGLPFRPSVFPSFPLSPAVPLDPFPTPFEPCAPALDPFRSALERLAGALVAPALEPLAPVL